MLQRRRRRRRRGTKTEQEITVSLFVDGAKTHDRISRECVATFDNIHAKISLNHANEAGH
jgi:hypothetical protein